MFLSYVTFTKSQAPLINQWKKFTPSLSWQSLCGQRSKGNEKGKKILPSQSVFCMHYTKMTSLSLGKCSSPSTKCIRWGHGDTALNLHLQEHQRDIQMNLQEGQGRWGERRKDQRDRLRVAWKDWHFRFALIRTEGNHFELVQKYTHPLVWSVCAFSPPQTSD